MSISPNTAQSKTIGDTFTITPSVAPLDANNRNVNWTSSNTSVATVSSTSTASGTAITVTCNAAGTATITATAADGSGVTASISLTVKSPLTSISLNKSNAAIGVNATTTITATTTPNDVDASLLTWTTSNSSIATISVNGKIATISGKKNGFATITVASKEDSTIKATCTIKVGNTLAEIIASNPTSYLGKKVSNYTANGESDWRIFYSDGTNVFLILTNYLTASKAIACNNTMITSGTDRVYWATVPTTASSVANVDKFSPITSDTMKWTGNYSTYENGRCVSTLLDTNRWTAFVNSDYADMAIGSPTMNMWVASWNIKNPSNKLYCNNCNEFGFFVGSKSVPDGSSPVSSMLQASSGYTENASTNMYYPVKTNATATGEGGYWLASPERRKSTRIYTVEENGWSGSISVGENKSYGLRPVVCLKSTVTTNSKATDTMIEIN